ncbi:thioredoxin-disulfide reductase [Streptomyces naganishii]|uniref:Thioredoxin reductase n=1 Tax=Streptomyces naganishii JCM 4654 TaxID=1306179 RepID=A0A918Y1U5_9ACTN|nr:thioredoxin-disulfide reductase [Streptomyces naganishii]GHD87057.1 thioredoxin reductase [Streptomyces naganishii JCM 4654]
MSDGVRDVVVIGSGPAAYTAALYTARADLHPLVLRGSVFVGGALATTTEVENYPGFPKGTQGPSLMDAMAQQAERFGAEFIDEEAVSVALAGEVKTVTDTVGGEHRARTAVVATGTGHRKLGVPQEDELSGRGVSWCATCDGFFFRDHDIAVVGGGDTALEEATFLSRYARSVTVIHRRDELRASKAMQRRAFADPKVSFAYDRKVVALHGDTDTGLTGLTLRDTVTGETEERSVTGLFIAIGHRPRSELFAGRLALDEAGYVLVEPPSSRTSVPGVFAAGDVVDRVYRQAVTAAGSGCVAALDAERYLAGLHDGQLQESGSS